MISLKSFIASIRPMTWPVLTSPPWLTKGAEPGAGDEYQMPVSGAFTEGRAGGPASAGAAPFVAAGREVAVGQVIGLIEAMKLFNEIKSDLAGRVVRFAAENGALVKAKQPLIEVDPL